MDLTPSDEQRLLRESADRFVSETYTADHRRKIASDPLGFSADIWKQFADLGWLALPIAEAHGGLGGGADRDRHPDGSVRARARLRAVSLHRRDRRIADLGMRHARRRSRRCCQKSPTVRWYLAFAHSERQARFDLADVRTTAKKDA